MIPRPPLAAALLALLAGCRDGSSGSPGSPAAPPGDPAPPGAGPGAPAAPSASYGGSGYAAGTAPTASGVASRPEASGQPGTAALPALGAESWLIRLDLPGGGAASVSVPLGATSARPILVALHGAGDRPEWACGGWRGVTDAFPFIVCPFGQTTQRGPEPSRVYVTSPLPRLTRDIDEALAALRERFGPHVDARAPVLAGFSLGAHRAVALVTAQPGRWPAVVVMEGAYDEVNAPWARAFHDGGGQRVLLGCSQGGCATTFRGRLPLLERAGLGAQLVDARLGVHNLNAEMVKALHDPFAWLTGGLPGWPPAR